MCETCGLGLTAGLYQWSKTWLYPTHMRDSQLKRIMRDQFHLHLACNCDATMSHRNGLLDMFVHPYYKIVLKCRKKIYVHVYSTTVHSIVVSSQQYSCSRTLLYSEIIIGTSHTYLYIEILVKIKIHKYSRLYVLSMMVRRYI